MGFCHKFVILLSLPALFACSPKHDGASSNSSTEIILNPDPDPALEAAAENILGPKCASCHGASGTDPEFLNSSENPGLDILQNDSKYVKIGQGQISLLYQRSIDNTMPPGNPLSQGEADAIKAWIDDLGIVPDVGDGESGEEVAATFSDIESNILAPKCYGCHDGHSTYDFGDYSDILYGFVAPYNLSSTLYTSITSGASSTGNVMPKNQTALTTSEIEAISSWIMSGAPNN
ncbi:MAG: c-type cytochrome [Bdellovibrionales bacterium]